MELVIKTKHKKLNNLNSNKEEETLDIEDDGKGKYITTDINDNLIFTKLILLIYFLLYF